MAAKIALVDTSILIDFFRKSDKTNSQLFSLIDKGYNFCISAITEYEIFTGANVAHMDYWKRFLENTKVLNFDSNAVVKAVAINNILKIKSKQIGMADLFIAAIAVSNNLPVATLNIKHFDRIEGLSSVDL